MTYGRFTLDEWEKRGSDPKEGGNPFLEANGRWHRISDFHVIRGLGIVNYQAEECDPREVEAWLREQAEKDAATKLADSLRAVARQSEEPPEAGVAVTISPGPDTGSSGASATYVPQPLIPTDWSQHRDGDLREMAEDGKSPELREAAQAELQRRLESDPPHRHPFQPHREGETQPALADFARDRGWPGKGRITNDIKKQYRERYGPH